MTQCGEGFARPVRRIAIDFKPSAGDPRAKPLRDSLSVVAQSGRSLWLASDETAALERVLSTDGTRYDHHRRLALSRLFRLPGKAKGEADIEGLAIDRGHLWVTGSHSLVRRNPNPGKHGVTAALDRLDRIETEPNRWLLGRVPLAAAEAAAAEAEGSGADGWIEDSGAACLPVTGNADRSSNALTEALEKDTHLCRFLKVPAKENGFDIEGLTAHGDRVLLGLRGPVLRGWAVLLDLHLTEAKHGELQLDRCGPNGSRYRKYFLNLGGLGIRELCLDKRDLLILAGPTMALDGPVAVYRWRDALAADRDLIIDCDGDRLKPVLAVPYGAGCDHAEGMTLFEGPDGPPGLLVVYDSPSEDRKIGVTGTAADLFALP